METEVKFNTTIKLENRDVATGFTVNGGWSFEGQIEKILNGDVSIDVLWGEEHLSPSQLLSERLNSFRSAKEGIAPKLEGHQEAPLIVPEQFHPK